MAPDCYNIDIEYQIVAGQGMTEVNLDTSLRHRHHLTHGLMAIRQCKAKRHAWDKINVRRKIPSWQNLAGLVLSVPISVRCGHKEAPAFAGGQPQQAALKALRQFALPYDHLPRRLIGRSALDTGPVGKRQLKPQRHV